MSTIWRYHSNNVSLSIHGLLWKYELLGRFWDSERET
jgi:hypothetical protein